MTKILVNPINLKHIEYLNNKDIAGYIISILTAFSPLLIKNDETSIAQTVPKA